MFSKPNVNYICGSKSNLSKKRYSDLNFSFQAPSKSCSMRTRNTDWSMEFNFPVQKNPRYKLLQWRSKCSAINEFGFWDRLVAQGRNVCEILMSLLKSKGKTKMLNSYAGLRSCIFFMAVVSSWRGSKFLVMSLTARRYPQVVTSDGCCSCCYRGSKDHPGAGSYPACTQW